RIWINIHGYIVHCPTRHADQLALRTGLLEMQPAQHPLPRAGMVVLHERQIDSRLAIALDLEGFQKKPAMIPKHPGLNDQHPRKLRFNYVQRRTPYAYAAATPPVGPGLSRLSEPNHRTRPFRQRAASPTTAANTAHTPSCSELQPVGPVAPCSTTPGGK